ncbi:MULTISPECIES: hypothetical protein [unclassified Rhizobium]|uniref:hypothetical protein n=1 Tax=unclassified Rhizobium TaxID=2613769 RepID=UPI0007E975FD|nr:MULTISPECIES: hypothetical protein [unclassified Rhizobium]ANK91550.1 hypothetical protein AMK01_CH02091 [Rhizobium sp. N6212]ANK97583.1 hypothetical protein AMK00_CH02093 [Rhizobium sp. N621]
MTDLWFEVCEGASMDQEKATLLEFRHLLDDPKSARLLGNDEQILLLAKALRQVDQLVRGRTDVSFRFIRMVDGEAYGQFASSRNVEIEYAMVGPPPLRAVIDQIMATASIRPS